jgi:nucleoside-diphosphate-sugar epimerase
MFTVIGHQGFVGSFIALLLETRGEKVFRPERDQDLCDGRDLGHVFCCAGVTADFRTRPFDTIEAHVSMVARLLQSSHFDSFLYFSSTRLYLGAAHTRENAELVVDPSRFDHLYNLSKLAGESLCLAQPLSTIRVARLSNVYGQNFLADDFLMDVLRTAVQTGRVRLRAGLASAKDYVSVMDVARWCVDIAIRGRDRLYNLASGENMTHQQIAESLESVLHGEVICDAEAVDVIHPLIDVSRLHNEFGPGFARLAEDLPSLTKAAADFFSHA